MYQLTSISLVLITINYPLYANNDAQPISPTKALAGESTSKNPFLELPIEDLVVG